MSCSVTFPIFACSIIARVKFSVTALRPFAPGFSRRRFAEAHRPMTVATRGVGQFGCIYFPFVPMRRRLVLSQYLNIMIELYGIRSGPQSLGRPAALAHSGCGQ